MLIFPFFDPTRICPQNLKKLPDLFIGWFSLVPRCHVVARARKKKRNKIDSSKRRTITKTSPSTLRFAFLQFYQLVTHTNQHNTPTPRPPRHYHLTLSFISLTTLRFITSHSPLFSSLQLLLLLLFLYKRIK